MDRSTQMIPGAPGSEPAYKESVPEQYQLPTRHYEGLESYISDGLERCTTIKEYGNAKSTLQPQQAHLHSHEKVVYDHGVSFSSSQFGKAAVVDPHNLPREKPLWRRKRFVFSALAITLVITVLAITLATLIPRRDDLENQMPATTTTMSEGPSPTPTASPVSLSNVMMNTRMTATWDRGVGFMLFYQTVDGRLHYVQVSSDQQFQGSRDLNISDAKSNTPLAATWSQEPAGVRWNLFYLDTENAIQMVWSGQDHNSWHRSEPLVGKRWKAASASDITFAAIPGIEYDSSTDRPGGGKTLVVCTQDNELRQIYYNATTGDWTYGSSISSVCGRSGTTARGGPRSSLYRLVNNRVELWTKDFSTEERINVWDDDGPPSPFNAANPGNICGEGAMFAYLTPENTIRGSNFTRIDSEDGGGMQWNHEYPIRDGSELLQNSALACINFQPQKGRVRSTHLIFYQLQNGTIQAAVGTPSGYFENMPGVEPAQWEFVNLQT